jgi:protoporphyrinogen/coproporphyrinogen III oxidase
MKRIAIIGGGISGLSAAFSVEKQRRTGVPVEYVLFESSSRLGGVLVTEEVDGCQIEAGPDSFLTEKPWASDLCRELGLGDQLVGSNDPDRKTYILLKGKLAVIPDGLMFMVPTKILPSVLSPLFSASTKLRMAQEWFHPPRQAAGDETVASFVERHYGTEMVDRLVDPLLSGVYGGDAAQLSVRAVLPRFADMEAQYGSLGRAMLAARKKMAPAAKTPMRPLFTSLKCGMQQMVDALVSQIRPPTPCLSCQAQQVQPQHNGWLVSAGYASDQFDGVIVATPTHAAADILRITNDDLASDLRQVQYTSSVTVNLVYDGKARSSLPPGFGFLVPRTEGKRMMAATFVHNKFPHRAPPNRALLRCFIGGPRNEAVLEFPDDKIVQMAREELRQILGLKADPLFTRIYRWKSAMAQYGVGHLERLQRIERHLNSLPGLALAGNGYRGIGVPDCIRSGSEAAHRVLSALGVNTELPTAATL